MEPTLHGRPDEALEFQLLDGVAGGLARATDDFGDFPFGEFDIAIVAAVVPQLICFDVGDFRYCRQSFPRERIEKPVLLA